VQAIDGLSGTLRDTASDLANSPKTQAAAEQKKKFSGNLALVPFIF